MLQVIAGNRYGFCPIPTEMSVKVFDLLLKYIIDTKEVKLLNTWYIRDDNAQPPQYILQVCAQAFFFFLSMELQTEQEYINFCDCE